MKQKCRCYINAKYYARQAKTGGAGMKNYKPCPIHENPEVEKRFICCHCRYEDTYEVEKCIKKLECPHCKTGTMVPMSKEKGV